jgi:hypothetical protein
LDDEIKFTSYKDGNNDDFNNINVNIYHKNLISNNSDDKSYINEGLININSIVSLYGKFNDGTLELLGQQRVDYYDTYIIYGHVDKNYDCLTLRVEKDGVISNY